MFVGKKRPTAATTKLGEILVEAGVINLDLVNQSLSIAKNSKLPIGRVLSMYGFANDRVIESAVAAQQGLREGRFNRQQASQLVRVAYTSHISIDQAQSVLGLRMADSSNFGEVGKMLLAAGVIEAVTLQEAEIELKHSNKTLGIWLIERKHLTAPMLINAFHLTLLCRDEALPKLDAVSTLQKIWTEKISLSEAQDALSLGHLPEQRDIHLAAFLILAEMVPQRQVIEALETCIERRTFVGEIMVEQMIVTKIALEAAVHLQEMFEHDLLTLEQGCEIYGFVTDLNMPLDELLSEFEKMSIIARFIYGCNYISDEDCEKFKLSKDETDIMIGISLLRSGVLEDKVVRYAAQILCLIDDDQLTEKEAIGMFNYCVQMSVEPTDALDKFDFKGARRALAPADDDESDGSDQEIEDCVLVEG